MLKTRAAKAALNGNGNGNGVGFPRYHITSLDQMAVVPLSVERRQIRIDAFTAPS